MNIQLLLLFIALTIVNVVLQTIKSIVTVKSGKTIAALINALAYGVYTVVIIYTMCDLDLWLKAAITAGCNFIGVWIVKFIEEKARKDKLWKIEATVTSRANSLSVSDELRAARIPYNFIITSTKHTVYNCFCETQEQSRKAKEILDRYKAKYFVSESKSL